jgi:hypothetical protein
MKFETGKTYFTRSICDRNCIFRITVISRTAKTIRANVEGEGEKTLRIIANNGIFGIPVERVMPFGRYSMAPVICAADVS